MLSSNSSVSSLSIILSSSTTGFFLGLPLLFGFISSKVSMLSVEGCFFGLPLLFGISSSIFWTSSVISSSSSISSKSIVLDGSNFLYRFLSIVVGTTTGFVNFLVSASNNFSLVPGFCFDFNVFDIPLFFLSLLWFCWIVPSYPHYFLILWRIILQYFFYIFW